MRSGRPIFFSSGVNIQLLMINKAFKRKQVWDSCGQLVSNNLYQVIHTKGFV
jgi:hypothetical protein